MSLKTDYKNYIPSTELRRYVQVSNGDGTVSLRDVTVYTQEGDDFGAADINATNEQANAAAALANRIYDGVDLSQSFAGQIAPYSSVWTWVQARIQAGDFCGLNVCDYIPFEAGGYTFLAEIAGIDTYYGYNAAVPHHIDFITRECWPSTHSFNRASYNNGTSVSPSPLLASDLHAWLNSLSMQVPNAATANPALISVNYTTTGVYDKLPSALKAVIVPKRLAIPTRYSTGSLLANDNNTFWTYTGPLWIPSEIEVLGHETWGSKNGYSSSAFAQYPIFANTIAKRIKRAADTGAASNWWLLTADGGTSTSFAIMASSGRCDHSPAVPASEIRVPICFCVA